MRLQHRDFALLRLLDLHDHLGLVEHVGGSRDDPRAGLDVSAVLEIDAAAGLGLDDQLVPGMDQLGDRRGGQPDAIFVDLDLFWHSDAH